MVAAKLWSVRWIFRGAIKALVQACIRFSTIAYFQEVLSKFKS